MSAHGLWGERAPILPDCELSVSGRSDLPCTRPEDHGRTELRIPARPFAKSPVGGVPVPGKCQPGILHLERQPFDLGPAAREELNRRHIDDSEHEGQLQGMA